jgi:hypothetical protein
MGASKVVDGQQASNSFHDQCASIAIAENNKRNHPPVLGFGRKRAVFKLRIF